MLRRDIAHDLLTISANLPGDEHGLAAGGLAYAALSFLGAQGRSLNHICRCDAQIEAVLRNRKHLSTETCARLEAARNELALHACNYPLLPERKLAPHEEADTAFLLLAIERLSSDRLICVLRAITSRIRGDESLSYPDSMRRMAAEIRSTPEFSEQVEIRDAFAALFEAAADEADTRRATVERGDLPFGSIALNRTFHALAQEVAVFKGRDEYLAIPVEDPALRAKLASIPAGTELDIHVDLYRTSFGGKREVLSRADVCLPVARLVSVK